MDEIRFLESACMYKYIKVYIKASILKYAKLHSHMSPSIPLNVIPEEIQRFHQT